MIIYKKEEAIDILLSNKPLVIFQGEGEWGPRALGKRSILFDPRKEEAKYIVNKFKKREFWRPTAGTVLLDYAHDYFDLGPLKESPYMSYAVDAKDKAYKEVPAIVHADGTCRVQTLKAEDNLNYYNLIYEFYKNTNIPILLNTSFNLAGYPIVDSLENAIEVCKESEFKYLYLPESKNVY